MVFFLYTSYLARNHIILIFITIISPYCLVNLAEIYIRSDVVVIKRKNQIHTLAILLPQSYQNKQTIRRLSVLSEYNSGSTLEVYILLCRFKNIYIKTHLFENVDELTD